MDKDQQPFTAESVDEEIDQLTNNNSSIFPDLDTRFMHELHHVYKEDADSLKRVWERLERYSMQQQTSQEPHTDTAQKQTIGVYHIFPFQKSSSRAKYPASQLFTVLAATIIGIFLVGSLTWVLAITHPAGPGAAKRLSSLPGANADPYSPFSGKLALDDPLSNNSRGYGWQEASFPDPNGGSCQFIGNAYHVIDVLPNGYIPCHTALQASNFTLEVQMRIIQGNCGGLSLRDTTSAAHAYYFRVCQDGSYKLSRFDGYAPRQDLISGSNAAIHTGLSQSNLIAAVANGSTFDLYANHEKIATVNDSRYSGGLFGVSADGNTEVVYTHAKMWTL